jgi:cobalt transport protein ATP-binding subunit
MISNAQFAIALQAEGLRFAYPSLALGISAPWVIDGLDLWAHSGEWLAVMGASDAGKTTLCLLLAGLAPHLTGGKLEGQVTVAGRDTQTHPPPALSDTVGLLFQEPEAQLFNPTVEAEVAWGLENLGLPAAEIQTRVDDALALLRLPSARHRKPGELSGGEKKRLALASVLAMRPALLILDEPMGGLDPVGRQEVLAALAALRSDRAVTIVMTESDPEAVAAFADRLVVLHEGRIALEGTPREIFGQAERLVDFGVAIPQIAHVADTLNRKLDTEYDFLTVKEAQAALSLPFGEGEGVGVGESGANSAFSLPPQSPPEGEGAIRASDLWFWYDEGAPVLRGVDLIGPRGQFVALVGANGSGKTTLVKHFNGLLRPRRGQVTLAGEAAAGRSVGELARQVGFLFQHPEQQIFSATVRQELAFGPRNLGLSPAEVEARVESALARFNLATVADRPPAILSYGQRRRVTLACLAAMDPPVLVLDEPTVGLDAPGLAETFAWLTELHDKGRTILLVTHDMALVAEHADRVLVLHQGQIIADGTPEAVFAQPELLISASLTLPPVLALAQALGLSGGCLTVDSFCDTYAFFVEARA